MLDLLHSLQERDIGHLRIVAECWGIELNAPEARSALSQLIPQLLRPQHVREIVSDLPSEARAALDDLLLNNGTLPWSLFTRRYGEVREMGPGRRDRERPFKNPVSPAEVLWYRALLARAFFDAPTGPQEFACIPDDLIPLIPSSKPKIDNLFGRPANPAERAYLIPAGDRILDHACTILAAVRTGLSPDEIERSTGGWNTYPTRLTYPALLQILINTGLLGTDNHTNPEATRSFLEASRGGALLQLAQAWLKSTDFNELRLLPNLRVEGDWQNDPLRARQAIIDFLLKLPEDTWWNLEAFVAAIRQSHPDFQRPAGDYDSWYIREINSGSFLRGFDYWDQVDGALIRYLITGPLHWLGMVDLAAPGTSGEETAGAPESITAFRLSKWSGALLHGVIPEGLEIEDKTLIVRSDARISVPRLAPRAARYQVARISSWESEDEEYYSYRLTPASLERARSQGLQLNHILTLLRRYAPVVPPTLVKALERWDERGVEARLERVLVLHLSNPEQLTAFRNSRAARFLGKPLGPTAIIVKPNAQEKVLAVLAEMGYLGEATLDE
jgi:hypothetical protein